jgi:hypothetical protein
VLAGSCERSDQLNICQPVDSLCSAILEANRILGGRIRHTLARTGFEAFLAVRVLGSQGRRTIKIAFDNHNGYIVAKLIAAKIRCGVIDVGHEVLRGK